MGLALASLVVARQPARAMDFFTVNTNDGRLLLVAQGEIKEGDDRRLHEFVARLPAQTKLFAIGLDSPGGNLREGVYLANSIHSTGLPTIVSSRGMCASACFLMFAAGSTRMASINARIGVHNASADGEDNGPAQAVTTLMARQAGRIRRAILHHRQDGHNSAGRHKLAGPTGSCRHEHDDPAFVRKHLYARRRTFRARLGRANHRSHPDEPIHPCRCGARTRPGLRRRSNRPLGFRAVVRKAARPLLGRRTLVGSKPEPARRVLQQAPGASDPDFNGGCQEATSRLVQFDRRRLAEPDYRLGWNSL